VIEDMFGGPHRKDEVTRTEQLGWSARNQNGPQRGVPAKQSATALANGCASMTQNSQRISLDTADFVRHIPYPPQKLTLSRRFCSLPVALYFQLSGDRHASP